MGYPKDMDTIYGRTKANIKEILNRVIEMVMEYGWIQEINKNIRGTFY